MTPAIKLLQQLGIRHAVHQYEHEVRSDSYGLEAVDKLAINGARIFKTLVVELTGGTLAVGVIPVTGMLNMKATAKSFKSKRAVMASPRKVERSTGYVLGGVSPLGQKKQLLTIIDSSALQFTSLFVSAGKRGLEIELDPQDLARLSNGHFATILS